MRRLSARLDGTESEHYLNQTKSTKPTWMVESWIHDAVFLSIMMPERLLLLCEPAGAGDSNYKDEWSR